jgi:hypothetical protein
MCEFCGSPASDDRRYAFSLETMLILVCKIKIMKKVFQI